MANTQSHSPSCWDPPARHWLTGAGGMPGRGYIVSPGRPWPCHGLRASVARLSSALLAVLFTPYPDKCGEELSSGGNLAQRPGEDGSGRQVRVPQPLLLSGTPTPIAPPSYSSSQSKLFLCSISKIKKSQVQLQSFQIKCYIHVFILETYLLMITNPYI